MNLLLFSDDDRLETNKIAVRGRRLKHLRQVHRANAGDKLRIGEIGGLTGEGEILAIREEVATLAVALACPSPEKRPPTPVLALPRPQMLSRIRP